MSTLEDVARYAGVSPSTVSRAFTHPDRINSKTKDKILEAAARVNYRPLRSHSFAHTLAEKPDSRSKAIGFHFFANSPDDRLSTNPFYGNVLSGALSAASANGFQVVLSSSVGRVATDIEEVRRAIRQLPDATILAGPASPDIICQVSRDITQCVLVDAVDERGILDSIVIDNVRSSIAITEYLIRLGHRRIGFILPYTVGSYRERLNGYLVALHWTGLDFDRSLIIGPDVESEGLTQASIRYFMEALPALLSRTDRPTAIIGASDGHSHLVYRACANLGLRIPEDVSVVGFDDVPSSASISPPMTSVHIDTEAMGALAVARLLERSAARPAYARMLPGVRMMIGTRIIERDSCAPPRAAR